METVTKYKGFTIYTRLEEHGDRHESPRENDNQGLMVMFHNEYRLPNELDLDHKNFESREDMEDYLCGDYTDEQCEELGLPNVNYDIVLPISMVDHSGIFFSIGVKHGRDCGQVGFIVANVDPDGLDKDAMIKQLELEVKSYDQRQRGEFYEYEIEEMEQFIGEYKDENEALQDAKRAIDYYIKNNNTNVYEYEICVKATRRVRVEAKTEDEALDLISSEDYDIITESTDDVIHQELLFTNKKYDA